MNLKRDVEVVEVVVEPLAIGEVADLEPLTLGAITEVTGSSAGCECDDNVIWGS